MKKKSKQPIQRRGATKDAANYLERARVLALKRSKTSRDEAMQLLLAASRLGSAEAMYAIGTWHLYGRNVPKSAANAAGYFASAARHGHAPAIFNLAVMNETGDGVRKHVRRAFELYLKAANLGDSDAIKSVARCLYHGIGVGKVPALGRLVLDLCK